VKYLQKIFSRHFYRSPLFWALILISSYTIGGFILLPKVIKGQLVKQVELNLGWQTEIGKVAFNPYTFTLVIDNVAIKNEQGEEVVAFEQYITDFELRSAVEGAFTFANLGLIAPSVNLTINKNGVSNFQQALQSQAAKLASDNPVAENQQTDSALVKLLFDNIAVSDGIINIVDHSQLKTMKYKIDPLNFKLTNFSTYTKDTGNYQLDLNLGNGQTVTWSGAVGLAPFRSTGTINITGIKVHKYWPYVAQKAPYNLRHGIAKIDANYDFKMTNNIPEFDLFDSTLQLRELQIAQKKESRNFIDIDTITAGPVAFNLANQDLQIKALAINAIDFQIERNKQGQLTFLAPFAQQSDSAAAKKKPANIDNSSANEFKWSIGSLKINNSQVNLIDKAPSVAAQFAIHKINLQLSGLSQDLARPLPLLVSYQVNDSDENTIKGQIAPAPLNLNATVNLKNLALPPLQPYLSDLAKINLEQGKLSVTGAIALALDAQGETQGGFEGDLHIQDFNTKDQILKKRLVGWQSLVMDPIKVNFNPLSIAIDKIQFINPYSRLIITKERSVNFSKLLVEPKNSQQAGEQDKQTEAPLALSIGEIILSDGNAYFADLSLIPEFATSIQNINGKISGLSVNELDRADVNITGTVDDYGKMLVKGKINPLGGELDTDINVKFDKIELATLTPYSGRYAGYVIDKGKLSLDLNYKIAQRKLLGTNRLILDQFKLGTKVDSEEALNLPIKLAVALFKDRNGIIDISLPTQGDLDNPDFEIGALILKAFLNVMTKAVTSPFSMIANLGGTDNQQLNAIAFDFGSKSLNSTQQADLATLADVLKNRPQLILEIHATVDKEKDGLALKQQKLTKKLLLNDGNSPVQAKRIKSMEGLLSNLAGTDTLSKIKVELQAKTAESTPEMALNKYEKTLYQALLDAQPLSSLDLTRLAKQRISIIQEHLIKNNNVPENQVFVLRPSLKGRAEENKILTVFSLNTH
jgi:hypothetical protein